MSFSIYSNLYKTPLINFRFISLVVGSMCLIETVFLLICLAVSFYYKESDFIPFLDTIGIMFVSGIIFTALGNRKKILLKGKFREGMLAVTITWLILSIIGMLPFVFGNYTPSVIDAFFETLSGFTTTGATIFQTVEQLPHGILFWRSLIQWQGGIGIVAFSLALLPLIGQNSGILYNAETTGITHERFMPKITQVAKRLGIAYISVTIVLFVLLLLGDMSIFDSICHSLTCVSTGGYSTKNGGIMDFNSPYIEYILTLFMFLGSFNLTLIYFAIIGKPKNLFKDEEVRWFFFYELFFLIITFIWVQSQGFYSTIESSFRHSIFQVLSLTSTTGYLTADINTWKPFFFMLGVLMMTVCGCAGSTTGGIKMSRLMVLIKNLNNEFKKRIHPRMATRVRINGQSIGSNLVVQVLAFISLYCIIILVGSLALTFVGNDFTTAVSSVFTSISNVGPSFGKYAMSFSSASGFEKILLSIIMLIGRLEVFTVITLLYPSLWKK